MKLYCADIRGADEKRANIRGRGCGTGSAFGLSLLACAYRDYWGGIELPLINKTEKGRPYFSELTDRHFSISHTRSHVLVGLSEFPVGVDVEARRERSAKLIDRLSSEREKEDFEFFELWVLRESLYKLCGEGDLRSMRFQKEKGRIVPPVVGARCRLFDEIPGCAAAASCFEGSFPETIIFVSISDICT